MGILVGDTTIYNVLGIFTALLLVVITFFKWRYSHWNRLGIPTSAPTIPFGNLKEFLFQRTAFGLVVQDVYKEARSKGYRHIGLYFLAKPVYMPIDPELIKRILQKDFVHFMNRGLLQINENHDPLAAHLFTMDQEKWKGLRQKFSPTFTSGQLKAMFQTVLSCGKNLEELLKSHLQQNSSLNIKDILARYTTDSIASCAFGIECNSMKNPDAEFRKCGRLIFEQSFLNGLRSFAFISLPAKIPYFLGLKFTRSDVEHFFMNTVKDVVQYRETNDVHRKDFMDLLIQIKNHGKLSEEGRTNGVSAKGNSPSLTIEELAAQTVGFFIGGFETSATTMTFALFELAQNQEVQNRLRHEINAVLAKYNGELTYDAVMEMHYLQNVIDEILRMHPSVPLINRECTKDYQIPDSDIVLKKGTSVVISNLGMQTDPEYYPNPDTFDPDRFSVENKNTRTSGTHLPFGDGPRNCIGLRFGLLQTKIGLITFVKNYRITLSQKTPLPLIMDAKVIVLTSKHNIWIDITSVRN